MCGDGLVSSHHSVEVTVHHDWTPAPQVNVLLPPVTHLDTNAAWSLYACLCLSKVHLIKGAFCNVLSSS